MTGPYGHDGAYANLEAYLRAHIDPVAALAAYDRTQAVFPQFNGEHDWGALDDPAEIAAIAAAVEIAPVALGDDEVAAILAFFADLSDPVVARGRLGVPETVPSGLSLDR